MVSMKESMETKILLVYLYLDDMLVTGNYPKKIDKFKESMKEDFEMTYLGNKTYFLGLEFLSMSKGVIIHQMK